VYRKNASSSPKVSSVQIHCASDGLGNPATFRFHGATPYVPYVDARSQPESSNPTVSHPRRSDVDTRHDPSVTADPPSHDSSANNPAIPPVSVACTRNHITRNQSNRNDLSRHPIRPRPHQHTIDKHLKPVINSHHNVTRRRLNRRTNRVPEERLIIAKGVISPDPLRIRRTREPRHIQIPRSHPIRAIRRRQIPTRIIKPDRLPIPEPSVDTRHDPSVTADPPSHDSSANNPAIPPVSVACTRNHITSSRSTGMT
jgi:hypothetical protein